MFNLTRSNTNVLPVSLNQEIILFYNYRVNMRISLDVGTVCVLVCICVA